MWLLALSLLIGQNPLNAMVDKQRVLLVFAGQAADARVSRQLQQLDGHAAELKDRDVVVIPVFSGAAELKTAIRLKFETPVEQAALRKRFRVRPGEFAVVLVGKDGGEKMRSASPIMAEALEQTIDAMPMRQDEMKGRGK